MTEEEEATRLEGRPASGALKATTSFNIIYIMRIKAPA
jgi:hypothetical protein